MKKMKKLIKILLITILLITDTVVNAQKNVNITDKTTTKTLEIDDQTTYTVKTETEAVQKIKFKDEGENSVNKKMADTPVFVTKTIWIDDDKDSYFDKKIRLFYRKEDETKLNYKATVDGLLIKNSMDNTVLVSLEGIYQLDSKNVNDIFITIEKINQKK